MVNGQRITSDVQLDEFLIPVVVFERIPHDAPEKQN